MKIASSKLHRWLSTKLPGLQRPLTRARLHWLYSKLYNLWASYTTPIQMHLHGHPVWINGGNTYPFVLHNFPWLNAPLVELCHQLARVLKRPINVVDIGSAFGDSVLLLKERCPGDVGKFICLEGDQEFYGLLKRNMSQFHDVETVQVMLARESTTTRSLVKHHRGTAAAIGDNEISAVRLDSVSQVQNSSTDLLKIDVDGFDGEVLGGATGLLRRKQPAVIFEWHPKLIDQTGNDLTTAFSVLGECGYNRYCWFNNVGTFSHFSGIPSPTTLSTLALYLLSVNSRSDEHFDVVALPDHCPLDVVDLATMEYARSKVGS